MSIGINSRTTYFFIIWSLGSGAAALRQVLPSFLQNSIEVREVLREVLQRQKVINRHHIPRGCCITWKWAPSRSLLTMENPHPESNSPENTRTNPRLTRGSADMQPALKLFSQEEVTGLLLVLSICNNKVLICTFKLWKHESIFVFRWNGFLGHLKTMSGNLFSKTKWNLFVIWRIDQKYPKLNYNKLLFGLFHTFF